MLKNTFFYWTLRWLPLPILKPLDPQRQLCKWVSKLFTIYFISTLVGIFVFILGEHKLSFYISTALWLRTYDVCEFSGDHTIEVSHEFLGGVLSFWFSSLPSLGATVLVNVEIKHFQFVTWRRDWCVMWLCGWGSLILSHQTVKFGIHRPCESGDTFLICRVTTWSMYHVTLWERFPHPKSPTG